jgi:hypothetical protein
MSKQVISGGAPIGGATSGAEAANGAVADRGPFGFRCSLPGLDAAGRWHCLVLVCLRLGDAVAPAHLQDFS